MGRDRISLDRHRDPGPEPTQLSRLLGIRSLVGKMYYFLPVRIRRMPRAHTVHHSFITSGSCTLDEFVHAHDTSSLVALFDAKGFRSARTDRSIFRQVEIENIEDVLSTSPQEFHSVICANTSV